MSSSLYGRGARWVAEVVVGMDRLEGEVAPHARRAEVAS